MKKHIKDFKLFLESLDFEDSENNNQNPAELIKEGLTKTLSVFIKNEEIMRKDNRFEFVITSTLNSLEDVVKGQVKDDKEMVEYQDLLEEAVTESFSIGKYYMIHESIEEGINKLAEKYEEELIKIKHIIDGEEWKLDMEEETETEDLSTLSQKELEDRINFALDNSDFEEVGKLSKYLESTDYDEMEVSDDEKIDYVEISLLFLDVTKNFLS